MAPTAKTHYGCHDKAPRYLHKDKAGAIAEKRGGDEGIHTHAAGRVMKKLSAEATSNSTATGLGTPTAGAGKALALS